MGWETMKIPQPTNCHLVCLKGGKQDKGKITRNVTGIKPSPTSGNTIPRLPVYSKVELLGTVNNIKPVTMGGPKMLTTIFKITPQKSQR